jgi:hypothetical protein
MDPKRYGENIFFGNTEQPKESPFASVNQNWIIRK